MEVTLEVNGGWGLYMRPTGCRNAGPYHRKHKLIREQTALCPSGPLSRTGSVSHLAGRAACRFQKHLIE